MKISEINTSDFYSLIDDIYEKALNLNCKIIEPKENELFIDLDSIEALEKFQELYKFVSKYLSSSKIIKDFKCDYKLTASKTSGHYHVIVSWPFKIENEWQRLSLQFLFGSDHTREVLNSLRLFFFEKTENVFFELKTKEDKVLNVDLKNIISTNEFVEVF